MVAGVTAVAGMVAGDSMAGAVMAAGIGETKKERAWLRRATARSELPPPGGRPLRLVLLGAPGVGKGTQAELLSASVGACHLSTGDVFRAAQDVPADERTPALTAAVGYMRRGELVPDDTAVEVVAEREECMTCKGGFLLDGFPRTVIQAQALEKLLAQLNLKLDGVINYQLPLEQVIERLSGRRTCPNCKAVFHLEAHPPKIPGICDNCGGRLVQRDDDRPEAVRVRMKAYEERTMPLAEFYQRRGLLVNIDAGGSPEEIFHRTMNELARGN